MKALTVHNLTKHFVFSRLRETLVARRKRQRVKVFCMKKVPSVQDRHQIVYGKKPVAVSDRSDAGTPASNYTSADVSS